MTNINLIIKNRLDQVLLLPFLFLLTFAYILPEGLGQTVIGKLIWVAFVLAILIKRREFISNFKSIQPMVFAILLYFIVSMLIYAYQGGGWRAPRTYINAMLFILIIPVITNIQLRILNIAILIGSFIMLVFIYYLNLQQIERVTGNSTYINPIIWATGCYFFYTLSIFSIPLEKNKFIKIGLLLAALIYGIAVMLTESRGVIIALPIPIIALVFFILRRFKQHESRFLIYRMTFISFFICLAIGISLFKPIIVERWQDFQNDIQEYKQGNYKTSIGTRLVIWETALELFKKSPMIGTGNKYRAYYINEIISEGTLPQSYFDWIEPYIQGHSHYMQVLQYKGVLGLLALLGLMLIPIAKGYQIAKRDNSPMGYLLLSLGLGAAIAGLTDDTLNQPITIYCYLFCCAFAFKMENSNLPNQPISRMDEL